jgi:hypothetical protein
MADGDRKGDRRTGGGEGEKKLRDSASPNGPAGALSEGDVVVVPLALTEESGPVRPFVTDVSDVTETPGS